MQNNLKNNRTEESERGKLRVHQNNVMEIYCTFNAELHGRIWWHDQDKLDNIKKFVKLGELDNFKYGSPEHKAHFKKIKPVIDSHYKVNRHHPEHFKNGINDMNLIDIIEMCIDWYEANNSRGEKNIDQLMKTQAERFNLSKDLTNILLNTMKRFDNQTAKARKQQNG